MAPTPLVLPLLLAACGGRGDDTASAGEDGAWRPDLACPGDPGCPDAEGPLYAGAAARTITPECWEDWEDVDGDGAYTASTDAFRDCGCDRLCEGDEGWPGPDEGEGDGEFHAAWIAGFGNGRPARDVHDDLWARAVYLRTGETSVALVALDLVGWFYDNTLEVRRAVEELGVDVDLVVVHATHDHEGPDTLGQWGRAVGQSGLDPDYMDLVVERAAEAVAEAAASAEPAELRLGIVDTAAPFGAKGTANTVRDSRDPVIIDQYLRTARLVAADDGATIATLVHWANHPEVLGSDNTSITSDFPHYVREGVENGVRYDSYEVPGVGGVAIYVNGPVGGLMTPLGVTVTDGEGVDHSGTTFETAEALGKVVAELALDAVADEEVAADPSISLATTTFYVPVENVLFQAAFILGVFDREAYHYDPDAEIGDGNVPELLTEAAIVRVGPLGMLTVPGELAPELAIGGYDGSRVNSDEYDFIDPDNPNPPDVSQAPDGPYFQDLLGGEHAWIVGLGSDELGYLIPSYDYELDPDNPYIVQAEGDHYEETNSVGPSAVPRLEEAVGRLFAWESGR